MYFVLFLSMSLLNIGFTQEKKGYGVAQYQHKRSADGPADADEFQTKKICMIPSENDFVYSTVENKWPWLEYMYDNSHTES